MSVLFSQHLQQAIYLTLVNSASLSALVGDHIYDAVPSGTVASTYVLLGEEKASDRSDYEDGATRHDVTINVVSNVTGFSDAKLIANEVCAALAEQNLVLSSGSVRRVQFRSAKSRRDIGAGERRIDLVFRILVDHT